MEVGSGCKCHDLSCKLGVGLININLAFLRDLLYWKSDSAVFSLGLCYVLSLFCRCGSNSLFANCISA